jgi:hypothetical protein
MIKIWFDRLLKSHGWFQVCLFFILIGGLILLFSGIGSSINISWLSVSTSRLDTIINELEKLTVKDSVNYESVNLNNSTIKNDTTNFTIGKNSTSSNSNVETNKDSINIGTKALYVFSRLIDPGSINDSSDGGFATIISVIGWILCSGLLLAIITNAYFERIKKIENGQISYKLKNHCIIIGSENIYLNIIRKIRAGNHKYEGLKHNCKILIFSSEDSREIKNHMRAFLNPREEKNVFVYRGNRLSADHLNELHFPDASALFILGEPNESGCDSKNISCIDIIANNILNNECETKVAIPCFVMLNELKNFELLMENEWDKEVKKRLDISHFNSNDSWTSVMFSSDFKGFDQIKDQIKISFKKEQNTLHFIIVGFNRMGQSVMNQAIRTLHFGGNRKVKITAIDIHAKKQLDYYLSTKPGLQVNYYETPNAEEGEKNGSQENKIPNISIELIQANIESQEIRNKIKEWATTGKSTLIGIAVCFADPTMSLYDGLAISKFLNDQTPVFIRQNDLHGIAHSVSKSSKYGSVTFFGMLDECGYFFKNREERAKEIHNEYQEYCNLLNEEPVDRPNNKKWDELDEGTKWSNRFKAESQEVKELIMEKYGIKDTAELLYFAKDFVENFNGLKNEGHEDIRQLLEKLMKQKNEDLFNRIEYFAEIEHNRWIGEKIISGWDYADIAKQDKIKKLHPDIKPYAQLKEITKMYDRGGFL